MMRAAAIGLLVLNVLVLALHSAFAAEAPKGYIAAGPVSQSGRKDDLAIADDGPVTPRYTIYRRSSYAIANSPEDAANLLQRTEQRKAQQESLLGISILGPLKERFDEAADELYQATHLRLAINSNNAFQAISDGFPGTDRTGVASDLDILGTLELINRGTPTQGQMVFHVEGRWDYGTTPPFALGLTSVGTLLGTADAFNAYQPTFLPFRNLYWQQGSSDAGWLYRLGKITPDQILGTSFHLSPWITFLPTFSNGTAIAFPDSGLGVAGVLYPNDRLYVLGLVSDANANRQNWGNLGTGHLFKAFEFGYKVMPMTDRAGYSKVTLWHHDGTKGGVPLNSSLGPSGYGIALKFEQELTSDGSLVGVLKYSSSFNKSGVFRHLASAHLIQYDPPILPLLNDVAGVAFVWGDPNIAGARDEANFEIFYRFPITAQVDATLSYQSVFNPALNPGVDRASAFTIRARTSF